jgi:hypothetical protein
MTAATVERTAHISFAIGYLERMNDTQLTGLFTATENGTDRAMEAPEIREYLQTLRDKGYSVVPCGCPEPRPDGGCPGWN